DQHEMIRRVAQCPARLLAPRRRLEDELVHPPLLALAGAVQGLESRGQAFPIFRLELIDPGDLILGKSREEDDRGPARVPANVLEDDLARCLFDEQPVERPAVVEMENVEPPFRRW